MVKQHYSSLPGVAQLTGSNSTKGKVTGSFPGQGTCLVCRFDPGQDAYGGQQINVSLSRWYFYPSLSPSLLCLEKNKQ